MTYIEQDKNKKEKKYKEENYTFKPKINKRNNSYEKLRGGAWGKTTQSTQALMRDKYCGENFSKNYSNFKSNADIYNKEIILNNK